MQIVSAGMPEGKGTIVMDDRRENAIGRRAFQLYTAVFALMSNVQERKVECPPVSGIRG